MTPYPAGLGIQCSTVMVAAEPNRTRCEIFGGLKFPRRSRATSSKVAKRPRHLAVAVWGGITFNYWSAR